MTPSISFLSIAPTDSAQERATVAAAMRHWLGATLPQQITDGGVQDGGFDTNGKGWCHGRATAIILARLIAARLWEDDINWPRVELEAAMRRAMRFLLRRQSPDGQIDLGGRYSPNEVGFTLSALATCYTRLQNLDGDWDEFRASLKTYLQRGAHAVVNGSAYTANHRWAAAAPLAAVHAIWPDARYMKKIEDYLADGIDCDADGCWYEERSPNYNMVANTGVLLLADLLNRPELREPAIRNLEFCLLNLQPNGEADTSFSHRQDRADAGKPVARYPVARRVAQLTGDGRFTTLAQKMWRKGRGDLGDFWPTPLELDAHPAPLPAPQPLPQTYEKYFPSIQLLRRREEETALSLDADRGGHFYDTARDRWGGVRRSDDWFHLHFGDVVLQSVHLVGSGSIKPTALQIEVGGRGCYRLSGQSEDWDHPLLFRPNAPTWPMRADWSHDIRVEWPPQSDVLTLVLHSPSSQLLAATFWLWVRPNVELREGDGAPRQLRAGEQIGLGGGQTITLRSKTHEITISGLPQAAHRRHTTGGQNNIPSNLTGSCCGLALGLGFPVDLKLNLHLSKLANK